MYDILITDKKNSVEENSLAMGELKTMETAYLRNEQELEK